MPNSELLFRFFNNFAYQSPFWDNFFIFCARYLTPALALSVVFVFIFSKNRSRWRRLLFVYLVAFICWLAAAALKVVFATTRPFQQLGVNLLVKNPPAGFAFPSGHAAFAAGLSLALYAFDRSWGLFFLLAALLVGLSRVVVGLHWPLDILGGLVLAALVFGIIRLVISAWNPEILSKD